MAVNALTDGSFEGVTPFTGWTYTGAVTPSIISGSAHHGSKHARFSWPSTGSCNAESPRVPASPGQTWSVVPSLKFGAGAPPVGLTLAYYNSSGTEIYTTGPTQAVTGSWARFPLTFTPAPANTASVAVRIRRPSSGAAAGQATDVDAIVLTPESYSGGWVDPPAPPSAPNFFITILDDGSNDVAEHMPAVADMIAEGITCTRYRVSVPSCGPSRAAFFTGQFPLHNGVMSNDGGAQQFQDAGLEALTIMKYVKDAGGRTAVIGKWINDFDPESGHVPVGVDWFHCGSDGYQGHEWKVRSKIDGVSTLVEGTTAEEDYLPDVQCQLAIDFIEDCVTNYPGVPWFLLWTPFAPHGDHGYQLLSQDHDVAIAPRHLPAPNGPSEEAEWDSFGWTYSVFPQGDCGGGTSCSLINLDTAAPWFNTPMLNPPGWFPGTPMNNAVLNQSRALFRDRIMAAQAVSEGMTAIQAKIVAEGLDANTHSAFGTDNGFHHSQHTLRKGKGTAYDYDTRLTFVWRPPGGTTPRVANDLLSNIDIAPTVLDYWDLAKPAAFDGNSMRDLIEDVNPRAKRKAVPMIFRADETWEDQLGTGQPPSWDAVVGVDANGTEYLFVDYGPGSLVAPATDRGELYVLSTDPYLMHNRYPDMTPASRLAFVEALDDLRTTTGAPAFTLGQVALPVADLSAEAEPYTLPLWCLLSVDGEDLHDPDNGREQLEPTSDRGGLLAEETWTRDKSDHGAAEKRPIWAPGVLAVRIILTANSGVQLRDRYDRLLRAVQGNVTVLGTYPDGKQRRSRCAFTAIEVDKASVPNGWDCVVLWDVLQLWEQPGAVEVTVPLIESDQLTRLEGFEAGTAPPGDLVAKVRGPVGNLRIRSQYHYEDMVPDRVVRYLLPADDPFGITADRILTIDATAEENYLSGEGPGGAWDPSYFAFSWEGTDVIMEIPPGMQDGKPHVVVSGEDLGPTSAITFRGRLRFVSL